MTQKIIDLGQLPDGVGGDTNRSANVKCNENFMELYETRALNGANSDITSLSGLTTALRIEQGGTGGTTPASAREGLGLGDQDRFCIGPIEISAPRPYIDFHYNNAATDYDARLQSTAPGVLNAEVASPDGFQVNGASVWNDKNGSARLASVDIGGIGSYGFFLVNTGLTPGATILGSNMQFAHVAGNGQVSPIGTWRCMGDTVEYGRTLFQRIL